MTGPVVVSLIAVEFAAGWIFYKWGASIAAGKGRPRALGWWAVFFGFLAILILYLLPDQSSVAYCAPAPPSVLPRANVSEKLERLASLHEKGALTQEEFEKAKADALGRNQ